MKQFHRDFHHPDSKGKKSYKTPALVRYGNITDMTRAVGFTGATDSVNCMGKNCKTF
jgi:hypothetical protein